MKESSHRSNRNRGHEDTNITFRKVDSLGRRMDVRRYAELFGAIAILVIGVLLAESALSKTSLTAQTFPENIRSVVQPILRPHKKSSPEDLSGAPGYREALRDRYLAFAKENPGLGTQDVVWRVNMDLDKPFYSSMSPVADPGSVCALVNKYRALPSTYVPVDLAGFSSGARATRDTVAHFNAMSDASAAAGLSRLTVVSGYRSYSYQKGLYNRYLGADPQSVVDTYCARPGHSEHQTGRALDIATARGGSMEDFGQTRESGWVQENAWRYGFIVRYQKDQTQITGYKEEPWHITYVGEDAAEIMQRDDIATLEEYAGRYLEGNTAR